MENWIIDLMSQYGYFAVALLIAVENIFPPIPSEVILTFGGFMTTYTTMNVYLVILYSTIGSVFGAIVLYGVGRLVSAERIKRWLSGRLGKLLHLNPSDVEKAKGWFDKRGKKTVFFCRFIPIIRSLISIPAGMAKMSFGVFLGLTAAGTFIWNFVLVFLGSAAGKSWEKIAGYMDLYSQAALIVIVGIILILGILFVKKRVKFIRKQ